MCLEIYCAGVTVLDFGVGVHHSVPESPQIWKQVPWFLLDTKYIWFLIESSEVCSISGFQLLSKIFRLVEINPIEVP